MQIYEVGERTYEKFLSLLNILRHEFEDVVILNDSFSSLNNRADAIFKIKNITGIENFTLTIDSIKINLPLLKLFQDEPVTIYNDESYQILTVKGDYLELNLRYTSTTSNQRIDTFERNTTKLVSFSVPISILSKMESAAKSLKSDNFMLKVDGENVSIIMSSLNNVRKIKFYSIKTDTDFSQEAIINFPVEPLVVYLQLIKLMSPDAQELTFTLSRDNNENYYIETEFKTKYEELGLTLKKVSEGELETVLDEDEEVEEQYQNQRIQNDDDYDDDTEILSSKIEVVEDVDYTETDQSSTRIF